jgi:hypothetical protein
VLGFTPTLGQVRVATRSILAVPAASTMSENNFSDSGSTVSKKRNELKPSTVNILMFFRSNMDLTKWKKF